MNPSFNPIHNQVYEQLRQHLMQLHQMGIPGMDQVLGALNKAHVGLMGAGQAIGGAVTSPNLRGIMAQATNPFNTGGGQAPSAMQPQPSTPAAPPSSMQQYGGPANGPQAPMMQSINQLQGMNQGMQQLAGGMGR